MKIIHSLGKRKIENYSPANTGFLLTNRAGGYMCFYPTPVSKYNGVFFRTSAMYRVIESISLVDKANVSETTNRFYMAERLKEGIKESFFMPHGLNSFVYELDGEHEADIFLDIKQAYDNKALGRFYEISDEAGTILVKFTKKTDVKEDSTHGEEEYSVFLAIKADSQEYKKTEKWEARKYALDQKRNSIFELYVFNAFRIKAKKIVFSFSESREKALLEVQQVFGGSETMKQRQKRNCSKYSSPNMALVGCRSSLDGLIVSLNQSPGIYAGLPWFFQFWTRDEAISLKAAMLAGHWGDAKKIIRRQLNNLLDDGRIPNIVFGKYSIGEALASSDGVGWVFRRILDAIQRKKFSKEDLAFIAERVESAVGRSRKSFELEGLIRNDDLETWMDTSAEDGSDRRAGFRIEIQALQLSLYSLAFRLTKKKEYLDLELALKQRVRERFWNGKILADGDADFTARPNAFIACYIYPELLSREEWEECFSNLLEILWVEWGGLATIDKTSLLFRDEHTGEKPWSYHRGDVWFWVNNIAAIAMHRVNSEKFMDYIKKIIESSTEDILWKGAIGSHSELSSAKEQRAEGCFDQAWSCATFIELIEEVRE